MTPRWSRWLSIAFALNVTFFTSFSYAWMNQRPVIEVRDGNLFITSAMDKDITLQTLGTSSVNVNGINVLQAASSARDASQLVERWRLGALADIENTLTRLVDTIEGRSGLLTRVNTLEMGSGSNINGTEPGRIPNPRSRGAGADAIARTRIQRLTARVRQNEIQIAALLRKIETDECVSNPCQNGGTCEDLIEGYKCRCTEGWEGAQCNIDINECSRYMGTDLGCQHGATCLNLPGTYHCLCKQGWYGVHCRQQINNCSDQNSHELCGRGVCVNNPNSNPSYACICDQGWESESATNPACTKDVDECAGNHPKCSVNPMVSCINLPGTYYCGPCPQGYTGNGYYCSDINECAINNGGCSTSPSVQCINTLGSRICGACPTGYQGDGVTCTYVGPCRINNGGCHQLATCINTPGMSDWLVQCRCPAGYMGDGIGPNGCVINNNAGISAGACSSNPCHHGICISSGISDYTCRCDSGYTGRNCDSQTHPCDPNPCKNQGTCSVSPQGRAVCNCRTGFTGSRCGKQRASCGEVIYASEGTLQFPPAGSTSSHSLSCAWVFVTNISMVLNVTFTAFDLEQSSDCVYDFVQMHDGPTAGEQLIGRYCGSQLPRGGNIISSDSALYLWFHSDNSVASDGFTLQWNSIPPLCGGEMNADYGSISSPGWPGKYPVNRDCSWHVSVTPGRRIQFHLSNIMLQEHPTCANDYLEIRDGPSLGDRQLGLYCNHTHPPPLITPEDEVWLHFHSDASGQDLGFHITYSTTEGTAGCGGVYTAASGSITTPNFHEEHYDTLLDCEWKIQVPLGERIQIKWITFELENSRNCRFDSIEVYNGANREAPLIGRYCGTTPPPSVLSSSNILLIRFKSDYTLSEKGFKLNYEVWCGGEFTEETGVIKSPYYPNPYPASRTCTYKIIQPAGKAIELTIQDMDIEGVNYPICFYDFLEVHDGENENSTTVGTYCGSNSSIPEFPIMSTHNYMWLKFETDFSTQKRGFMATYRTVDLRCGGILKGSSGIIQSPSDNGRYSSQEDCTWIIQAPPGFVIQLNWLTFDLESQSSCSFDYVEIFENITRDSQQNMGKYCGSTKPPTMTTQSQIMSIKFRTDSSYSAEGFMASYIFVDASRMCGGHFASVTGFIKSPNYPEHYPPHKDCEWFIKAPNGHQVVLSIKKFDVEGQSSCAYDYLEIRNGGSDTSPLLGKYCGTDIPPQIKSFSNQIYLKFKSDFSRGGEGFYIEWDSNTIGCGGTLTSTTGSITSPGYPQPYSHSAECNWRIKTSAGSFIQFFIADLDLEEHHECYYDFIEIYEGNDPRNANLGKYCGSNHPPSIQTASNIANIRFRTDWSGSGRGFHINYQALCNTKLRTFRGVIESPNFPNNYPDHANCTWIIEAPLGNKLNITFSHFDVEEGLEDSCVNDYLKISEGTGDQPNREIGTFCGSDVLPNKIVSTEHQVFVHLYSDGYATNNGFRLEWVVNGCGGIINHPEGTITSPGWPNQYPENVDCEWNIEVDDMHSIEITLNDVQLEKVSACSYDHLAIYTGSDDKAPKLLETCHVEKDKPVTLTSTSNKLFIRFHSDFSFPSKGFTASYKSVNIKCGGRFIAPTGLIQSPNYPMNYPKNQMCEWNIQVAKNHLVNLTFADFDIEDSNNCTDDYVRIYDGSSRDAFILGSHCHNRLPPSYLSTSNELLVVMRTDAYVAAKGFRATYEMACGARIVTNDQGIISMDSAVGLHGDLVNCTWTIVAQELEDHVTLIMTDLQLSYSTYMEDPCNDNSIEIFEGDGTDGPSLGTWCNTTVPPPITSHGNALTIRATSQYGALFNVKFSGTYSVLSSACGGNYTAEHGTIATPGYPDSYPRNIECVWYLRTSPGNSISLNFRELDVIESANCDLDYVEVREETGAGKLIGVYCGQDVNQINSPKSLWVKFKSSADGTKKGFIADYSLKHGNDLSGVSGEIASPLYPNPCLLNGEYSWRILVDFTSSIQITFKDFHIESYGDECYTSLTIYDGYDEEAPRILEKCGVTLPETVRSSSNIVYIKFTTNSFRLGSWFLLSWVQVPRESGENEINTSSNECKQVISLNGPENSNYTFNSPGWPDKYDANLNCRWYFESVPGTHLILKFDTLDLEESRNCIMDQVKVYSASSFISQDNWGGWSEIGSFCYSNSTAIDIESTNIMGVNFRSDYAYNKKGFNATVRKVCGGQLTGPNGVIELNSTTNTVINPQRWAPVVTCQWNVTVRPGRTIEVKFFNLDIQTNSENRCSDHYLMLKNGGSASSPILGDGKYCGNVVPGETLQTTGNQLYVKVSGLKPTAQFKLTYREVGMNCGNEIVLTESLKSWEISTPHYPNIPSPHTECFWTIIAPAGEEIDIHFMDRFDLTWSSNCDTEYLEIRDGGTESSKLVGRYCGFTAPTSIHTTGNMMYLHFYTEVSDPKNGFKATVIIGEQCGGIIRGRSGTLKSPNYPSPYPNNVTCGWYIVVPPGNTMKIEFQDINLPDRIRCESDDYVSISEQIPSNFTRNSNNADSADLSIAAIGQYCGSRKPGVIETSGNEAVVIFSSNTRGAGNYKGFSLNFTATNRICGGSLDGVTGEFSSPGYPNIRSHTHRYCKWRIKVPEGYKIQLDILDLDLGEVPVGRLTQASGRLVVYNDFNYMSPVKRIIPGDTERQFFSTSNTMLIWFWSGSTSHRGFKARYTRVSPSVCGSVLTSNQGTLLSDQSPLFNLSSFICNWKANNPSNDNSTGHTLTLTTSGVIGTIGTPMSANPCPYREASIILSNGKDIVACVTGNLTNEVTVRTPSSFNTIIASKTSLAPTGVGFNLKYRWYECGGILGGPSHTITAPTNRQYPIECVWHAKFPDNGEIIVLTFKKLNLAGCSGNYITIRNGGSLAPLIDKYCGSILKDNIISQSNELWIEYRGESQNNEFELELNTRQGGCGGLIQGLSNSEISSPGFPQQYPNNTECLWEIVVENGYHIGLVFVDRFNLEGGVGCPNDYIQIFDWREDTNTGDTSWFEIGKVCGRDTPQPYNSTGNRMKVLFRTNNAVRGDGFRALWNQNCGGTILVSQKPQYLHSPGWPGAYGRNLVCNYTFLAPEKNIIVEFKEFKLENARGGVCRFDNVSIISGYGNDLSTWCGADRPPVQRVQSRLELLFKTDAYLQTKGFQIKYSIDECGGLITEPGAIESPSLDDSGNYYSRINCTWIVRAPAEKTVVLRFERFEIEASSMCYFDYIGVYSGLIIDPTARLALLCGRSNETLPVLASENGTMTINFVTDHSMNYGGFEAKIVFTSGPAAGCGGRILLSNSNSQTFRTQRAEMYESLEDCHWLIKAPNSSAIKFEINSMDLKNSIHPLTSNGADSCSGDYLEIRDGAGPFSELIGRYCGNVIPPPIVSSSNNLWIRLVTDGTWNGRGVTGTLSKLLSPCGNSILTVGNKTEVLQSPGYHGPYPAGLRCRWALSYADKSEQWKRLTIHFVDFDLGNSVNCSEDVLSISDRQNRNYVSEGLGEDFVFNGNRDRSTNSWIGGGFPQATYLYCGDGIPHDYHSGSSDVEIQFKSSSNQVGQHTGFKLEYSTNSCPRNYTGVQGRIIHEDSTDCSFTITAAVGHTISLYFNSLISYDFGNCVNSALEIHDGDFSNTTVAKLCGMTVPNPVFSTGNKLSLHSWALRSNTFDTYDMTYTTTDKGRGCGGKLYNYAGKFTSPLYPGPYRNSSECTWEISVPIGSVVKLEFSTFDLGSKQTCRTDFMEIIDVRPNGESLLSTTFCGEDNPAEYRSQYRKVLVRYHTTVNNGGTGWVIAFGAQRHE